MLLWLENFLIRYPELALFLVIAVGYWIGGLKIGPFNVGPVTGALFAGLVLGHFVRVPVSSMTKSFLFLLFLFGIGYSVGPQFIQAMKRGGGIVTGTRADRSVGLTAAFSQAAAVAMCHCSAAAARKRRSVRREIRWR